MNPVLRRNGGRKTPAPRHTRLRASWDAVKSGAGYVKNPVLLALVASLYQTGLSPCIWVPAVATALLAIVVFFVMPEESSTRIWLRRLLYGSTVVLCAVLVVRPFYKLPARTYVTVTEGMSIFDVQRYVTEEHALGKEKDEDTGREKETSRLVIANHGFHRMMAGALHRLWQPEGAVRQWVESVPVVGRLCHNAFPGRVEFLTPTKRRRDRVVPITLGLQQMETWSDLAGAPCTSYQFNLATDGMVAFTLDVKKLQDLQMGYSRLGTDFAVLLQSKEESNMRMHLVARQEVTQWHDVPIYNEFDGRTARYTALVFELLNSPRLREFWARHEAELWKHVPNDRERLRLLLLRASLDNVVANGNIFRAQLLPDLIRMETLLSTAVTSPDALVQDQLLYWGTRQFLVLSKHLKNRFSASRKTFEAAIASAKSTLDPVFLDEFEVNKQYLTQTFDRILPRDFAEEMNLRELFLHMDKAMKSTTPRPINPQLAWLRKADWHAIRDTLPGMNLKRSPLSETERESTAAAEARTPTLEDAWEELENAWFIEYARRVMAHVLALAEPESETADANANANANADATVDAEAGEDDPGVPTFYLAVLEGLLQQRPLLEEFVDLRQRLFGPETENGAGGFLQDSPTLRFLHETATAYERMRHWTLPAPMRNALDGLRVESSAAPSVLRLLVDDLKGEGEGPQAEPFSLLWREAAFLPVWQAFAVTIARNDALQTDTPEFAWARWIYGVVNDPLMATIFSEEDDEDEGNDGAAGDDNQGGQTAESPQVDKAAEQAEPEEDDPAEAEALAALIGHVQALPMDAEKKAHLLRRGGELVQMLISLDSATPEAQQKIMAEWSAWGIHQVHGWCHGHPVLDAVAELIERSAFTPGFTFFDMLVDPQAKGAMRGVANVKEALRGLLGEACKPDNSVENRQWQFIDNVAWFTNLSPEQRPKVILHDETRGVVTFQPACPRLEEWIREASSADTDRPEGTAYPHVAEALLLDLLLRTLEDETVTDEDTENTGYHTTELGIPRKIFQTLTKQTVEEYVADSIYSAQDESKPKDKPEPLPFPPPSLLLPLPPEPWLGGL